MTLSSPKIFEYQGRQFIAGLEWKLVESTLRETLANTGATLHCVISNHANKQTGISTEKASGKVFSIAGLAAIYAQENGIKNAAFLLRADHDQYIGIGILEGLPVTGYDFIGHADDADKLMRQFLGEWRNEGVIQVGISAELDPNNAQNRLADIDDLVALLSDKNIAKTALLTQPPASHGSVITLACLVLAVMGYWGYSAWEDHQTRMLIEANSQNQQSPQEIYTQTVVKPEIGKHWTLPHSLEVLRALSKIEVTRASWSVNQISCQADSNRCLIKWQPAKKGATFEGFLQETPKESHQALHFGKDSIDESYPLKKADAQLSEETFPARLTHVQGIVSRFQYLAATGDAQYSYTSFTPLSPLAGATPLNAAQLSLNSAAIYLLPMLYKLPSAGVGVSKIDLNLSSDKPIFGLDIRLFAKQNDV